LKCISLWQPWASLVVWGFKRFETRAYPPAYTGLVAIHAARKWNRELKNVCRAEPFRSALEQMGVHWGRGGRQRLSVPTLPFGAVIGTVEIYGQWPTEKVAFAVGGDVAIIPWDGGIQVPSSEKEFGDYSPGRRAWELRSPHRLTKYIPFRGRQGWFDVPDESIEKVGVYA
jgi:activating signal cointegrator 1